MIELNKAGIEHGLDLILQFSLLAMEIMVGFDINGVGVGWWVNMVGN